jgi:phospholipid/cholesterol/gamma-HCH transport system substrate-binding protein
MRRRGAGATAIASNPVLVGVATTLVIVVAVFLAYNANAGLPWVPSYRLTAEVPGAASLVRGNEVRIGGFRAGVVDKISPVQKSDGTVAAKLDLKLETDIKPLPIDSTITIRPRSSLGLKYVEVTRGTSDRGFPEGGSIPLSAAKVKPVEFDEFFNMFDEPTRIGNQQNLRGFGDALAGRGEDINTAIRLLVPLVRDAVPVLSAIADPATDFDRFFASQARTAEIVAPVAVLQAELWVNLSRTLGAFANIARPFLQDTISKGPKGQETAIETLPIIRPWLGSTEQFFAALRPGSAALNNSAPDLAAGFERGIPALQASVGFNKRLGRFVQSFETWATDPIVPIGFRDLANTVNILNPVVAALKPTQTVCNYVSLFFRNAASLLSDGDTIGNWLRFMVITTPVAPDGGPAPNGEGGPSQATARGGGRLIDGIDPNYLHLNNWPNTSAPGQPRECEAGNEPYLGGRQVIGSVPGNQGTETDDQPAKK